MSKVLNPQQRAAVEHLRGPMLVLAGAGTGKTTVLVERIAHLIRSGHAQPGEILVLTFTKAAAGEIAERVAKASPDHDVSALYTGTFHAYCYDLLRRHDASFHLLTEEDMWIYLRQRIHQLPLERFLKAVDPAIFLNDLLEFFSRCGDELVGPEDYARYVHELERGEHPLPRVGKEKEEVTADETLARCREIRRVYAAVGKMLAEKQLGTFGSVMGRAVALLKASPVVLAQERKRARFLLIDEFQDSNFAQIELASLLAGDDANLFAVGDPDQAIYRFRGATSGAFDEFLARYKSPPTVALAANYRSQQPILDAAYGVICTNPNFGGARPQSRSKLKAARKDGKPRPVEFVVADRLIEANDVALTIERLHDAGVSWSDCCVLTHNHAHRDDAVQTFVTRGIPFAIEGADVLDTTEARDLLAVLRALDSTGDSVSLLRVASFPQFGIEGAAVRAKLHAARRGTQLIDVLASLKPAKAVLRALDEVRAAAPPESSSALQVCDAALKTFRIERSAAVSAMRSFIAEWQEKPIVEHGTLREFLKYLDLFGAAHGKIVPERDSQRSGVRLMTVHGAKGREFRHVFVLRAYSPSFPKNFHPPLFEFPAELRRRCSDADSEALHKQEERRLFYVAMTRAQDSLTLYGSLRAKKETVPPGFMRELAANKSAQGSWTLRPAADFKLDLAASAAGQQTISSVAPWLFLDPIPREALTLSASAIQNYERCPLQYKLSVDWALPTEPEANLLYGSAMHAALRDFVAAVRTGGSMSDEAVVESFRAEFMKPRLADEFQRSLYIASGERQLKAFLASFREHPPKVLATEKIFTTEIGGVAVQGRIDRIDAAEEGVAIVDYKTGSPRSQDHADDSLQLSLYAIAADRALGLKPHEVVFYNLEDNTRIASSRTREELQDAEDKVRAAADGIRRSEFEPTTNPRTCESCPYYSLCPQTEQRLVSVEKILKAGVQ